MTKTLSSARLNSVFKRVDDDVFVQFPPLKFTIAFNSHGAGELNAFGDYESDDMLSDSDTALMIERDDLKLNELLG